MSSRDFSRRGALAVLGLALLASGCNFRPLYGTLPGGGSLVSVLSAIDIEPPSAQSEHGRVHQRLRNELIFRFTGGGAPAPPLYRLAMSVTASSTALTIEPLGGIPTSELVVGSAQFTLKRIADGAVILKDTITARASFDRSPQRFAALRAKRDAENRAMETLAELMRTRIAAKLAGGH